MVRGCSGVDCCGGDCCSFSARTAPEIRRNELRHPQEELGFSRLLNARSDATCVYDTFTGTVTARGELSMWKSSTKTALFSDGGSLLSRLKLAKVANEPDTGLVGPLPVLANLFYKP